MFSLFPIGIYGLFSIITNNDIFRFALENEVIIVCLTLSLTCQIGDLLISFFKRKAKSVYLLSKQLLERHGGNVPGNFEDLEKLHGVGHKTASVVMSQGFGYPAFPVDTHIHRLAQRWGLTSGKNVVQTEKDLKRLFPKKSWNKLHLQIIWYGREYCQARECYGIACKICKSCYPKRKKPIKTKKA